MSWSKNNWRQYYDRASAVNFVTDRAFALVEYDGEKFSFLFASSAFKNTWISLGVGGFEVIYRNVNVATSPLHKQPVDMCATSRAGSSQGEVFFSAHGPHVRLAASCLSAFENHAIYDAEIADLSDGESGRICEWLDAAAAV